jgi:hypothetical protein
MRIVVPRLATLAAAAAVVALSGCATTATQSHVSELRRSSPHPAIVLMPLDVELMEMDVGGVLEPKPEWTAAARRFITDEVRAQKARLGYDIREYSEEFARTAEEQELVDQLIKLHAVVGKAIRQNRKPLQHLHSLGDKPQWSLGEEVRVLRERTGADYALFVHVRDSYASEGRKLVMIAGAALKMGLMGGIQSGFASLVDLRTGDIVWFNQLGRATGDLRSREPAVESVKVLFKDFPQ